jgi:hypothetical protein
LGEEMDWMMRKMPSVLAKFASLIFPSGATIPTGVQIVPQLEFNS